MRASGSSGANANGTRRGGKPARRSESGAARKKAGSGIEMFAPETHATESSPRAAVRERATDDTAGLAPGQLLELYRCMYETRRLEEHLVALYRQNKVV